MTSFTDLGLHASLVRALEDNNIVQPTEIQEKAIPILLEGERDLVGLAQTGTGKTAAFGLPLLQHIQARNHHTQALVLAPTRELGQQIARQLVLFSQHLAQIAIRAVYGGTPLEPQIRSLRRPPHVLVATPGRLIDLVGRNAVDLTQVKYLILDEADEMLNMGFQPAIDRILSFLPTQKSLWLFSATMPQEIKRLVNQYMARDHVQVKISPKNIVNENIQHQYMVSPHEAKQDVLKTFISEAREQRGIIFCRTKATVQRLADNLARHGLKVDALHGDLSQNKRDKAMRRFKSNQLQALVATDIAARGIDVKDLHYVIHYNLPEQLEYYTHRSGRTARAGKQGISLCLVSPQEVRQIKQIARTLSIQFQQLDIPNREGLDKLRLQEWAQKLINTSSSRITPTLLHTLEKAFEGLSKQELIAKLVAHVV